MSINELLSVDVQKIYFQRAGSTFDEYNKKYFSDDENADLKTNINLQIGISEQSDLALVSAEAKFLDIENKIFIELEVSFYFSIIPSDQKDDAVFKAIEVKAKPYITSEIANIVKNITSQGNLERTLHLPYTFLQ